MDEWSASDRELWDRAMVVVRMAAPLNVTVHVRDDVPDGELRHRKITTVEMSPETYDRLKRLSRDVQPHEQQELSGTQQRGMKR